MEFIVNNFFIPGVQFNQIVVLFVMDSSVFLHRLLCLIALWSFDGIPSHNGYMTHGVTQVFI